MLASICDVLLAALTCDAGDLLSDEAVCAVVQAAYHIGHQSGREGPLLTGVSRRAVRQVVTHLFRRASTAAAAGERRIDVGGGGDVAGGEAGAPGRPGPHGLPACVEVLAFAVSLVAFMPEDEDAARDRGALGGGAAVLRPEGGTSHADELRLTGITLAAAALEAGAPACVSDPQLCALVRDDLCRALVALCCLPACPSSLLAGALGLMTTLTLRMRAVLKHQLGACLQWALLPLAEGPPGEAQRLALEALAQMVAHAPSLAGELYLNFDCDMRRPPLFERTSAILARAAFPGSAPPNSSGGGGGSNNSGVALEALNTMLSAMAERTAALDTPALAALVHEPPEEPGDAQAHGPVTPPAFSAEVWRHPGAFLEAVSARAASGDVAGAFTAVCDARSLRSRVADGAEHFNRDAGKGLFLLRRAGLLPAEGGDAEASAQGVASFLRHASGLDKAAVGEYLGAPGEEVAAVLRCYAGTFDLGGLPLDAALRLYLDGFLLPGEAQKISRCLEAFAQRYHDCNPGGAAADADSAYVLSYSLIMLNTDLHNPQVKTKMTRDQFVRNNRGTNAGADWPRTVLVAMYDAIAADAIRMSAQSAVGGASAAAWLAASRAAGAGDGCLVTLDSHAALAAVVDSHLFGALWGPAAGALTAALEHGGGDGRSNGSLSDAAAGFASLAKVAASHGQGHVVDHVLVQLCRLCSAHPVLGAPTPQAAAAAFGADPRSRLAAAAACGVAARHGDRLTTAGWVPLVELLLRMQAMAIIQLPGHDDDGEASGGGGEGEEGEALLPLPDVTLPTLTRPASGGLLRGFTTLLSLDTEPPAPQVLSASELEAAARAKRCGDACRVAELVADSKFLEAPALVAFAQACTLVGAPGSSSAGGCCRCLDLLAALAVRNRDRITLLWPLLVGHMRECVTRCQPGSPVGGAALLTLMRICQRLLPYKHELADDLLSALRLALSLDDATADALMPRLAEEVRQLLRVAGWTHLTAPQAWDTLARLLAASSTHPQAGRAAFEALSGVMTDPGFGAGNSAADRDVLPPGPAFGPCCSAASAFAASQAGGDARSCAALALLAGAGVGLTSRSGAGAPAPALLAAWTDVALLLRAHCLDARPGVRDDAMAALLRVLLAADAMQPPAAVVRRLYEDALLPLVSDLVDTARRRGRDAITAERSLCAALPLLCKPLLGHLGTLRTGLGPGEWHALWSAVLDRLVAASRVAASDELADAVPEALKNCILVFATSQEGGSTGTDDPFWEMTWRRAAAVDAGLTPAMLQPMRPSKAAAAVSEADAPKQEDPPAA